MNRREEILGAIKRAEARLADLEAETERTKSGLTALRAELEALTAGVPVPSTSALAVRDGLPGTRPRDAAEKVSLFRSLFRGRTDVFPRRWENPKTGKSGYSPACANEWVRGICEKRRSAGRGRATCGECPHQAFLPVTDAEILKHLQGQQVIGVYPLLEHETCWFLAVDFDDEGWQEDVAAFCQTCGVHEVPVAIERSRSGNGAHAWFFFTAPVPAQVARKMGCFLITETMARRHQLSMRSYDRLFPNQDTMPKGGFGNLIALPLQREARKHGNSEFVDGSFTPYPDQWAFLASVRRLDPFFVQAMAEEATRRGQVIGVRMAEFDGEYEVAPWARPPSGRIAQLKLAGPLPVEVDAVIGQRLFVEKAGLPSPLVNQLKRLAAFQNPEFYKKQSMRLSTALTPRVIACAEDLGRYVALPRGCRSDAEALLAEHGILLHVTDERVDGEPVRFNFQGTLTAVQEQAARTLLAQDTGIFVAAPGVGKTVVGTYLVAARARSTLILVHRKPLLDQWVAQLSLFLGIDPSEIGQIGAGKRRPNGRLDVAMIQSLVRKGRVDDSVATYGHVITDECHHVGAFSFERVLSEVKARYVTGLTATPHRRDGHHPILHMQLGPIRFVVDPKSQAARRPFEQKLVVRETGFRSDRIKDDAGIQELYAQLAADPRRNQLILDDVIRALQEGRSPILLTERRDHLDLFAEQLRGFAKHIVVLQGGMKAKERRETFERLSSIPDDEERLLLATGRYIGEGFDDARLDTLFLALPVSWKGTLVQYTGRLHRLRPGKTDVRIYDYVDAAVPMLARMFEKRLRGYRAIGYAGKEAPLGFKPEDDETPIEEAALRIAPPDDESAVELDRDVHE
jgi:superfamily II DNA or RNA helicase